MSIDRIAYMVIYKFSYNYVTNKSLKIKCGRVGLIIIIILRAIPIAVMHWVLNRILMKTYNYLIYGYTSIDFKNNFYVILPFFIATWSWTYFQKDKLPINSFVENGCRCYTMLYNVFAVEKLILDLST